MTTWLPLFVTIIVVLMMLAWIVDILIKTWQSISKRFKIAKRKKK